jgi:thiol-disulfide isomerase/thioredoxin
MKKLLLCLISIFLSLSLLVSIAASASKPPEKGESLPTINLPIPKSPEERSYLGLSGSGLFKIPQIKAKAIIIEIFSMYCPYCQKDAPGVNELYRLIENNADIKDKIKLIGLGAGNSPYEVEVYKKTYSVPFPLFPDKDFEIHKACGEVRTPYFMVVKLNEDGSHQIVHNQLGNYPGAEPFLEIALKAAGLK